MEVHYFIRIGSSQRQPLSPPHDTPGPGAYGVRSQIGEGPKIGIQGRAKASSNAEIPGPGAYQPNSNAALKSPPKPTLKSGEPRMYKDPSTQKDNPGPGNYNPNDGQLGPKYG